jgi:hypothetical protein
MRIVLWWNDYHPPVRRVPLDGIPFRDKAGSYSSEDLAEFDQRRTCLIGPFGVVAAILGYLDKATLPEFTLYGLGYFAILLAMTWALNALVSGAYRRKNYSMNTADIRKKI